MTSFILVYYTRPFNSTCIHLSASDLESNSSSFEYRHTRNFNPNIIMSICINSNKAFFSNACLEAM